MNEENTNALQDLPLVVGIDLGGTQIRLAVLQGAQLLSRVSLPTGANPTPDRIIPSIYWALDQVLDMAGTELHQISGIGIGVAGPLDSRTGIVFAPPNLPGWDHVPLRDIFHERFNLPVFVENDANAAALGEYLFGAGRGCKDMVYLTISTGIGAGVIVNGQILGGRNGTAGELGHMTVDWHGERCNCGNVGCLESIASGTAIGRRANAAIAGGAYFPCLATRQSEGGDIALDRPASPPQEHGTVDDPNHRDRVDAEAVARAAKAGVPMARTIIHEAAEALGVGLVNIIHIFNPEMIILGGGVTRIGPLLMEPAREIVRRRAMRVPCEAVSIVQAQFDGDVGLVGAGALMYHSIGRVEVAQREKVIVGSY